MEQSYEILECGTKAKTLNPLGDYGNWMEESRALTLSQQLEDNNKWQQAEDSRVTYEIEPAGCKSCQANGVAHCAFPLECMEHWPNKPGQIVQGEIINGKLRIK